MALGGTDADGVKVDREMRLLDRGAMGGRKGRERERGREGREGRKEGGSEGGREGRLKGGPSFCSSRVSHAMTQTAKGWEEPEKEGGNERTNERTKEAYMYRL